MIPAEYFGTTTAEDVAQQGISDISLQWRQPIVKLLSIFCGEGNAER